MNMQNWAWTFSCPLSLGPDSTDGGTMGGAQVLVGLQEVILGRCAARLSAFRKETDWGGPGPWACEGAGLVLLWLR